GVAHDAARRGDADTADDVLVGGLRVLGALHDLQMEEPHRDGAEREEGHERHPAVALAELRDVGARYEQVAHALAASFCDPVMVAVWILCARRKIRGAIAPVARTCGSVIG